MPATRLNKLQRERIRDELLRAAFADRLARHETREHALALRVYRFALGDDGLRLLATLPRDWLPMVSTMHLDREVYGERSPSRRLYYCAPFLNLAESAPVPQWLAAYRQTVPVPLASELGGEIALFLRDEREMLKEQETLKQEVWNLLAGFITVERLAQDWPEAYAAFPHATLVVPGVPALRVEDVNARLAAAREAA